MKRTLPLAALLLIGCQPAVRDEFQAGAHRVSVETPPGWQHADQGDRHVMRHGDLQMVFEDLGPATREDLRREVRRQRQRWHDGQDREARTAMARIPLGAGWFRTAEQREAFRSAWAGVAYAPQGVDHGEIEERFVWLLAAIEGLRDPTADEIADAALVAVGEDQRRAVASRRSLVVEGRTATLVTTWQRLSHTHPRTYAVVIAEGRVLAIHSESFRIQPDPGTFDRVLASLRMARL